MNDVCMVKAPTDERSEGRGHTILRDNLANSLYRSYERMQAVSHDGDAPMFKVECRVGDKYGGASKKTLATRRKEILYFSIHVQL